MFITCALLVALSIAPHGEQEWQFVRPGILSGIGGMALVAGDDSSARYLIVHDNKKPDQPRIALVTISRGQLPTYQSITWPGDQPVDMETLTRIQDDRFIAVTSAGLAYEFAWKPGDPAVREVKSFPLPSLPADVNIEGFTFAKFGPKTVAIWGHRGELPLPGTLFWSEFDTSFRPTGPVARQDIPLPWPAAKGARGISDLHLDPSGTLLVSATADAGDDGPFQSALYIAGVFNGQTFTQAAPTRLFWSDQHKIEAFDLRPGKSGGLILATDDENLGSSLWNNFWPR